MPYALCPGTPNLPEKGYMYYLRLLLLILLLPVIACDRATDATATPTATPTATATVTPVAEPSALSQIPFVAPLVNVRTNQLVPTKPLSPQPIRIAVTSLPSPGATDSASKPPQVIPIPASPVLRVPPGFVVNVFADNLDAPRWLALTPKPGGTRSTGDAGIGIT